MCEIKTLVDWARNMVSGRTIVLVMKIVHNLVCVDIELSVCRLFSAWKIVGMTMTCNRCDVMNIM